jgi:hypothetical protein
MCQACENNHSDDEDTGMNINDIPEHEREEFFEYLGEQLNLVMDKAEKNDVLYDLITKWPKAKIVAFEMATVIENRVLMDEDNDDEYEN